MIRGGARSIGKRNLKKKGYKRGCVSDAREAQK
jgi:hypothetical protein